MTILLFFFLGASVGSFIALVVDRFPERSIVFPQSHCENCRKCLKAVDLVPIFSQLFHKSSCRFCGIKIPHWYGLFELACGLNFVLLALGLLTPAQLFLILLGSALALYDIKTHTFPILVWLIPSLIATPFGHLNTLVLIFLLLGIMAELINFGIGSGDFLYLATIALFLDLRSTLWIIIIGSVLGFIFCLTFKNRRLPFVPFLFMGYMMIVFVSI